MAVVPRLQGAGAGGAIASIVWAGLRSLSEPPPAVREPDPAGRRFPDCLDCAHCGDVQCADAPAVARACLGSEAWQSLRGLVAGVSFWPFVKLLLWLRRAVDVFDTLAGRRAAPAAARREPEEEREVNEPAIVIGRRQLRALQ